jgi:glycolate oxidase FAD binding subunit
MTIFRPNSADELRDVIAWACAEEQPLELAGGGSKAGLGRPLQVEHTVELGALSGIVAYEPAELVLTARAGTTMDEIAVALSANNQMLAFEPPDWRHLLGTEARQQTLGGAIACNLAGSRRIKAGAARDHFLGFQGVNGRGEIFKAGGQVVKNVTGYDLPKLLAGSYGTLAALTEITIKVLPRPETELSLAISGLDIGRAIEAMAAALNSPHEVSSAAHMPTITLLRLEGPAPSVAARFESLKAMLGCYGAIDRLEADESTRLWRDIGEARALASHPVIWRLSVAPGDAPTIANSISQTLDAEMLFDWGGGLIWAGLSSAPADGGATIIRAALASHGGHATLIRAPKTLRAAVPPFEPLEPGLAALTARVKDSFDPKRILNPGRMYAGL